MTPQDEKRHSCRRSGDFEKIAQHQGYVRAKLEGIDDSLKAIFVKIDNKPARKNPMVASGITALIMAIVYAVISMVRG